MEDIVRFMLIAFSGRGMRIDGGNLLDIVSPGNHDVYSTRSSRDGARCSGNDGCRGAPTAFVGTATTATAGTSHRGSTFAS